MGLLSKSIPGFFNGISQQAPSMRTDTQCEMEVNNDPSLVYGLIKRPQTQHLAILTSNISTTSFVHEINRDANEQYIIVVTTDTTDPIEVFKLDGTKCTVRYGHLDDSLVFTADTAVKSYLSTTLPADQIRAVTVADYTFIVNRTKTAAMTSATASGTITGTVQTFSALPTSPTEGQIYEIAGTNTDAFKGYYVKRVSGVWEEWLKPGIKYQLDSTTMPHRLVRTGTNEFTFADIDYDDRIIGDEESNQTPSFVGEKINNILFYQNRLGFMSRDNVCFSRTSSYYDFFRSTVLDVLDDHPVDISASGSTQAVVTLYESAPFDKTILLFSQEQQFALAGSETAFSPTTAHITPTTTFETLSTSNVAPAGANVYFTNPADDYVRVREYFIQPASLLNDAADITAHVPRLIPSGSILMKTCNSLDTLLVNSSANRGTIYVYKYYWVGEQKAQAAWCTWTYDGEIYGFTVVDTEVYMIIKRGSQVCLEKASLALKPTGTLSFRVHLDRLKSITGAYSTETKLTTWTFPYNLNDVSPVLVDPDTGLSLEGLTVASGTTVTKSGDWSSKAYHCGIPYTSIHRLNDWYMKASGDKQAWVEGHLQTRTLTLSFVDTGYFRVEVTPAKRDKVVHEFTGTVIGESVIGEASLVSQEKRFIIMANSKGTIIDIINDTYLPHQIQSGSLEGTYHTRAKRM